MPIQESFSCASPIAIPANTKPQLIVVVDTEEEFDWSAPLDRDETQVTSMQYIDRVQNIFDEYRIVPCYVIDYPVAKQCMGFERLQKIHADGRCEIGTQLHPWVTPPFDEIMCPENTYAGNLPRELEHAKLKEVTEVIEKVFGQRPTTYKAGRYGIGANTAEILTDLGYSIDLSVCPPVDCSGDGGPDFTYAHAEPYWFKSKSGMLPTPLLEIPVTGAFVGWAGKATIPLYNLATKMLRLKVPGLLSKISAVDRLMLSPEGYSFNDHKKLTRFLLAKGVRTFTWSFHSTSVVAGKAPYVKTQQQLDAFLESFKLYFDFFFTEIGGEATTPTQLKKMLEGLKPPA